VDQTSFLQHKEGPRVLLLGGRAWRVNHIDWQRRLAYVEGTEAPGRSRWKGNARTLSFQLSQAIKRVLSSDDVPPCWSRRARERLGQVRESYSWLKGEGTVLVRGAEGELEWWTFGGGRANATLAGELSRLTQSPVGSDNFSVLFEAQLPLDQVERA